MAYEIDFLPVGDGERSGDAIALRYGNLSGPRHEQTVVVIDGGTKESGQALIDHIGEYYGTDRVDIVILTHPDADHASGLEVVLEQMSVGELWMHTPSTKSAELRVAYLYGAPYKGRYLSERAQLSLKHAEALEDLATKKQIPIREPFAGLQDSTGQLTVLGPSYDYYCELLGEYGKSTVPAQAPGPFRALVEAAINWVDEHWNWETLTDDGETSPRNNSSAILALRADGKNLLLTADAGAPALHLALDYAPALGIDPTAFNFVQVPHHGSKRNVGPTILNRLLGPKLAEDTKLKSAFVSASAKAPKHPARKVTNAFRRRGAYTYSTEGSSICHHSTDAPGRSWGPSTPIPFHDRVED